MSRFMIDQLWLVCCFVVMVHFCIIKLLSLIMILSTFFQRLDMATVFRLSFSLELERVYI